MSKQEIMYSHVEDWKASGLKQATYCENLGLKLPTFSYWVQKYHKEFSQSVTSSFVSISKADPLYKFLDKLNIKHIIIETYSLIIND